MYLIVLISARLWPHEVENIFIIVALVLLIIVSTLELIIYNSKFCTYPVFNSVLVNLIGARYARVRT